MRRLMPAALGLVYALVPLFPSFIALTFVAFPGITLIPRAAAIGVFGVCGVLALYALAMLLRYPARGAQPLLLPLLAVFGAGLLAGIFGFDPRAGLLFTFIGLLGIVWHCAIVRFYDDRGAAPTMLGAYLVSGAAAAVAAIAMVALRAPAVQYALQHGRATGTFVLPGELAGYFIVLVPIAYAVTRVESSAWLRAAAWSAAALGVIALALSYSRAGWMGFAAAVAFVVATRTRHGARGAALVIAAGAIAVLLLFNAHHDPSEDYTRLSIWQAATQIIDRFPLTGVGPFNFSRLYAVVRAPDADATAFHAHSLYLTFFAEFGIVGVASVAWLMWRFAIELRRRLARASQARAFLALSVTAGLVGVAVQGLIDTVSVVIFGLWMPTLGLALGAAGDGTEPPDGD
jgi:putative inorganic carbon (hco3(-)) transporter